MGRQRVAVGMSGGVDSSVAACLLKEAGYDVIGVTMQTWSEGEDSCSKDFCEEDSCGGGSCGDDSCGEGSCGGGSCEEGSCGEASCGEGSCGGGSCGMSAAEDAARVAALLGIPHYVLDFRKEFHKNVVGYFIREYEAGRTPNPCVVCNRSVKWESLLSRARELGADCIATGHYAQVLQLPGGRFTVKKALYDTKDQTYALMGLTQEQLSRTLMPLYRYSKDQVREIAAQRGLPVAAKPDSEDICFVPDGDYASFIERQTGSSGTPGFFVDEEGRRIAPHKGIIHYTVGQRRGLGLPLGRRVFVKEIRPDTGEVVVSDNEALFKRELSVHEISFMGLPDLKCGEKCRVFAKIRYNHKGASAIIERSGADEIRCTFDEPQRAVTPGQAAVFYIDDYVACGGII